MGLGDDRIMAFGSFEEMAAYETAQQERALELLKPFQRALLDGKQHHWMRLVTFGSEVLLIAGWTYDLDVLEPDLLARYGYDVEGRAEVEAENRDRRALLERGFALTQAYSEVEPDGERGDTHAATMLPITEEEFEAFRSVGFSLTAALAQATLRSLVIRWTQLVGVQ